MTVAARRLAGWLVAVALSALVLACWFGTSFAFAKHPYALAMPFNNVGSSEAFLLEDEAPLGTARANQLALDAIAVYPFAGRALATQVDAKASASAVVRMIAQQMSHASRHDLGVQRKLYGATADTGAYDVALTHAEAMLRRHEESRPLLAEDFSKRVEDKRFASALATRLSEDASWVNGFLQESASSLPDSVLIAIAENRAKAGAPLSREILSPLLTTMIQDNRTAAAARIAGIGSGTTSDSLLPAWPGFEAQERPTPFDWRVGVGYYVTGDGERARLEPTSADAERPVSVVLVLEPGDYQLSAQSAAIGWRYGFSCDRVVEPRSRLLSRNILTVPDEGCDRQFLSIGTRFEARGQLGLRPLLLSPVSE